MKRSKKKEKCGCKKSGIKSLKRDSVVTTINRLCPNIFAQAKGSKGFSLVIRPPTEDFFRQKMVVVNQVVPAFKITRKTSTHVYFEPK